MPALDIELIVDGDSFKLSSYPYQQLLIFIGNDLPAAVANATNDLVGATVPQAAAEILVQATEPGQDKIANVAVGIAITLMF